MKRFWERGCNKTELYFSCFPIRPGESQLITSTMLWRSAGLTSLEDYLQSSLGIQQNTYPTILGLHFAEDLNLGRRYQRYNPSEIFLSSGVLVRGLDIIVFLSNSFQAISVSFSDILSIKKRQRIEDRLVWVKTALERSPINLGKNQLTQITSLKGKEKSINTTEMSNYSLDIQVNFTGLHPASRQENSGNIAPIFVRRIRTLLA